MNNKQGNSELLDKIAAGLKLASRRFLEKQAISNETVVICVNGEVKHVPARDILKQLDNPNS